jgi:serine/threonine-protein kinase
MAPAPEHALAKRAIGARAPSNPAPAETSHPSGDEAPAKPIAQAGATPAAVTAAPPVAPAPAPSVAMEAPSETGFLTVDTTPWSLVSENGKSLGQTPLVHVELASGTHVLVLKNPELGIETTYTVTIRPGKTLVKRIGIE